jgi:hypothetical protein
MLKDLMRKKEIVAKSGAIADEIIKRYPPEMDSARPGESKSETKKKQRKLVRALSLGKTEINRTIGEMRLGIYGKAKLYKTIQDTLLDKGYSEASARIIIEELAVTI